MKTYIMMFAIANFVSGGPIYGCNKINFLKQNGWNVVMFPVNKGNVYIKDLQQYSEECFPFILRNPFNFSEKQREKFLKSMIDRINLESEQIIIETGTDYTAYWGEMLAQKINAKHVVFLLDESNDRINDKVIDFWLFKHSRKELFCITPEISEKYLSKYNKNIRKDEYYSFKAFCTNSVQDYEYEYTNLINKADYTIGTIGRLDKIFVDKIVDAVCCFANENKNKKIMFCLFGGAKDKYVSKINKKLKECTNITTFISGYLWPIPLNEIKKCDLFISGSGSAQITAHLNIPTISMDVITAKPIGFIEDCSKYYLTSDKENSIELKDYIESVLLKKYKVEIKNRMEIDEFWELACKEYDKQLKECLYNDDDKLIYFDMKFLTKSRRIIDKIYTFLVFLIGFDNAEKIRIQVWGKLNKNK